MSTLLLISSLALAWDQRPNLPMEACSDELPYGVPTSQKEEVTLRCLEGYALEHDNKAKIATWVGYTLSPEESLGCFPRTDVFVEDSAIPKGERAELSDYLKSGYDRGHLAPDGDMSWDQQVEYESFLLSNMSPQVPSVNRGAWKYLETTMRALPWEAEHSFLIYAGNIYSLDLSKKIGTNRVVVPDKIYKIVVDLNTNQVYAFIFPNAGKLENKNLSKYLVSPAEIELQTGVSFPLPPNTNKSLVNPALPPPNMGGLTSAKREACRK